MADIFNELVMLINMFSVFKEALGILRIFMLLNEMDVFIP